MKTNPKKFRCMPAFMGYPVVMSIGALVYVYILLHPNINWVNAAGEPDPLGGKLLMGGLLVLGLVAVLTSLHLALWRVELQSDRVICRGMFPWETFEIPYESCNVGFEYHKAGERTFWWLYICEGTPPRYPAGDHRKRIASEKIRPGFIKLTYSDEVCEALLEVLPKQQRNYLTSAKRFRGIV